MVSHQPSKLLMHLKLTCMTRSCPADLPVIPSILLHFCKLPQHVAMPQAIKSVTLRNSQQKSKLFSPTPTKTCCELVLPFLRRKLARSSTVLLNTKPSIPSPATQHFPFKSSHVDCNLEWLGMPCLQNSQLNLLISGDKFIRDKLMRTLFTQQRL